MRENVNLIMILRKSSLKQVKNDLVGKKNVIRMRKQQLYYRLCILFIPCYTIRKIVITVLHTNMISWKYGNTAINVIVVLCANTMCILRDNYIIGNIVILHLKCYFFKQIFNVDGYQLNWRIINSRVIDE